jgi:hypothetical protein
MKSLLIAFFLFIFLGSCKSNKLPKGVLPEAEMIALLTDIHLIDGYTYVAASDTLAKYGAVMYRSVLRKYHTDSAGFRNSIRYYSLSPDHYGKMYDKVKANLLAVQKNEETRLQKERAKPAKK